MTTGSLAAAMLSDTDHVVCFGSDGAERYWSELVDLASRVRARMHEEPGSRWALDLDDTFVFAGALLGLWTASKTPVLAPRPSLQADAPDLSIDGILHAAATPGQRGERRRICVADLPPAPRRAEKINEAAELVLYTSGSTGRPKEICRALRNCEAEVAVLESLWGADLDSCRIFSTVSHRHVYGLLFRLLWPLLSRRPFATFDLEYPEQLTDGRAASGALISSPALLKRVGHLPETTAPWTAVFSSGGLLPERAAADSTRVLGACPVEVLGSTETSGVAWRRQVTPGRTPWRIMPSVEVRLGPDDYLEVRSPFTGHADWLRMGDIARLTADGGFELLGRGDHVAKIEDKRISLAEIERHLMETSWIEDAAAVALEDDARQYVGVLIKLSEAGASELKRLGRRSFNEHLKDLLRPRIEPVALPRKFRYVAEIPVDQQGKRRQSRLKEHFSSQ